MDKEVIAEYLSVPVRDTISNIRKLTPSAKSALLDLMLQAAIEGGVLPDDQEEWREVCGFSVPLWKKVLPKIIKLMIKVDGGWTFPCAKWSQERAVQLSAASRAGWRKKLNKNNGSKDRADNGSTSDRPCKEVSSKVVSIGTEYADRPSSLTTTSQEETLSPSGSKEYFYENKFIKLNEKDFKRWEAAYPKLNLRAELEAIAGWSELTPRNWFHAIPQALRNRQEKITKANGKRYYKC